MALVLLTSHQSQPASYCFVVPVRQLTCNCPPVTQLYIKLRVTLRINQPMNLQVTQPHRPSRHTPCNCRCIIAATDSVLSCSATCFFCYKSQLHAALPNGRNTKRLQPGCWTRQCAQVNATQCALLPRMCCLML